MRSKLKKILVGLLAIGTIGVSLADAQTLKPYGYIELAYVPKRIFFEKHENEFMSKLGIGLKMNLKKFQLDVNVEQMTYANKSTSIFFRPNTQLYNVSVKLGKRFGSYNLSLFFSHECVHPVDNKGRFWLYDSKRNKSFQINYSDFTHVGLRFEF